MNWDHAKFRLRLNVQNSLLHYVGGLGVELELVQMLQFYWDLL